MLRSILAGRQFRHPLGIRRTAALVQAVADGSEAIRRRTIAWALALAQSNTGLAVRQHRDLQNDQESGRPGTR